MADIASRLGVSRQLVSIALRGLPRREHTDPGAGAEGRRGAGLPAAPGGALPPADQVTAHRSRPPYAGSISRPSCRRYPWSSPGSSSAAAPAARPAA